jgi:transcriptional regulator with XRE-family HTH domain
MVHDPQRHGPLDLLAANLRRLRIARRLSLSQLARETGMSKATLSGIENGRGNPTVVTLAALSDALGVSVAELLDEMPLEEVRISRASTAIFSERGGLPRRTLESITTGEPVELAEIALAPGRLLDLAPQAVGSRMCVFVTAGQLIAGPAERTSELGTGDCMAFPADVGHLLAAGRSETRVLLLSSAPR